MSLLDIIRRSLRSLLGAKVRTILTAFAISVGAFAITLTLGASNGAQGYADSILENNFNPAELIVSKGDDLFEGPQSGEPQEYDPSFSEIMSPNGTSSQVEFLNPEDIEELEAIDGVEEVRPGITVAAEYVTRDGYRKYVSTLEAFDPFTNPDLAAGSIPDNIPDDSVIFPYGFLEPFGFESADDAIGATVRVAIQPQFNQAEILQQALGEGSLEDLPQQLASENQIEEREFEIIAVRDEPGALQQPGTEYYLYLNQADMSDIYEFTSAGDADGLTYLFSYVKVANGEDEAVLNKVQDRVESAGYSAQSVAETQELITQFIDVLQGIVTVFGLIAVIASVFGVINTMYISVLQRTREIGLMKALGMHKTTVNLLFLIEAALIGFLGGALGALTAIAAGTGLNPYISEQLNLGDIRLIDFELTQIAGLILALTVVAIGAGLFPARKAAKLDPIKALRTE